MCIKKGLEKYADYSEFKKFIIFWDVNSSNQKDLYKYFMQQNKNPVPAPLNLEAAIIDI